MDINKTTKHSACASSSPPLREDEIDILMLQLPNWEVTVVDGVSHLSRTFKFDDFKAALAFTNEVAAIAEESNHHPQLITSWGQVIVQWWTHAIAGLQHSDFTMAQKTDTLTDDR
ncbi:MAG: 4a-hydroxytetrahydrobiopterin dehydratase [Deltaproteobacteria bacterium]|nr:4a-hydroxytetrahydrobiopterin dehydratase [Deltaproteobacteria bacterium]